MTGREVVKANEELLRGIVRSIDKNLEYSLIDDVHESRFSLRLSLRGRQTTVSIPAEDLLLAAQDAVKRNAVRQKIKSARDSMMMTFVEDITGKKFARLLKQVAATEEEPRRAHFRRGPRRP
ncbi:MAG TPA: hypothetical protein VNL14_23775 [Candidatus Acidoferrales bacterium]|nr:hypothetical protein [Candidatus Acidoferrales bacterium]